MPRGGGNDDNRANQMNPNNDAYWQSRGYDERPDDREGDDDWEDDDDNEEGEQPAGPLGANDPADHARPAPPEG